MFEFFDPPEEESTLDEAISDTIDEYRAVMSGSADEAKTVAENLKTLAEVKSTLEAKPDDDPRLLVAIISALASLGGIYVITRYEQLNVLATKALPFIKKV